MRTEAAESWHCVRPECAGKPQLQMESGTPRCECGAAMKREYRSPVFRYLEFLRMEEQIPEAAAGKTVER